MEALPETRTVTLELMGQKFNLVSDEDESRVREVVEFLNQRLESVRRGTKRVQNDQIALLTALNIASELFEERARGDALRDRVRERSVRLLATIDQVSKDLDERLEERKNAREADSGADTHDRALPGL